METLLNNEAELIKTRLKCEGYEEHASLTDTNPVTAGANTGLKERDVKYNKSKVVPLIGRLHSVAGTRGRSFRLYTCSMFDWAQLDPHSSVIPQQREEM